MSQNDLAYTKNQANISSTTFTDKDNYNDTESALFLNNCFPLKHQVAGHTIGKGNAKFGIFINLRFIN